MTPPPSASPFRPADRSRRGWRFFWVTILLLAALTIALVVAGLLRAPEPPKPSVVEIPRTTLETIFGEAAEKAREVVLPELDAVLDTVYAPAYAAIPAYADFHYSVLGEYTELTEAALGQMSDSLYTRLFAGFEQRLENAAALLDQSYAAAFRGALQDEVKAQMPAGDGAPPLPLGEMTQAVLRDAIGRAKVTLPLATVAAGAAGSTVLKAVSATIAKKMAVKIAAKAAAKGAAKGGSALAGAGTGAALCAWTGPAAALCGIAGGIAAWFLTDAAILRIDEYFNRADFEAELRAMIDEDRLARKQFLEAALQKKAADMDAAADEILKDFTLRDLSTGK